MKNALMILMVLSIITVGAFAGDYHVGVNLKGTDGTADVAASIELGYTGDYLGGYVQVGMNQTEALAGLALTLPATPIQIYGGVGASVTEVTVTTPVVYTFGTHTYPSSYKSVTVTSDKVDPFFEAGIGLDMGPILWKVGWTNLNGNAVSFTMAASF